VDLVNAEANDLAVALDLDMERITPNDATEELSFACKEHVVLTRMYEMNDLHAMPRATRSRLHRAAFEHSLARDRSL
jgi:hypothetical protein